MAKIKPAIFYYGTGKISILTSKKSNDYYRLDAHITYNFNGRDKRINLGFCHMEQVSSGEWYVQAVHHHDRFVKKVLLEGATKIASNLGIDHLYTVIDVYKSSPDFLKSLGFTIAPYEINGTHTEGGHPYSRYKIDPSKVTFEELGRDVMITVKIKRHSQPGYKVIPLLDNKHALFGCTYLRRDKDGDMWLGGNAHNNNSISDIMIESMAIFLKEKNVKKLYTIISNHKRSLNATKSYWLKETDHTGSPFKADKNKKAAVLEI